MRIRNLENTLGSRCDGPIYATDHRVEVADTLRALPNANPRYFFWSGNGDARSAAKAFQRSYWKLFGLANLRLPDGTPKRCHPHMFRDTFAVELLLAGVPMDQVSLLLGHSSVKITERHYAPFCKARQQQLAACVKLAWRTAQPMEPNGKTPTSRRSGNTSAVLPDYPANTTEPLRW
jgi:hypothetical protein